MALYRYEAVNRNGESLTGSVEAASVQAAVEHLSSSDLIPVQVSELSRFELPQWLTRPLSKARSLPLRRLAILTQEWAALLRAGMTLDRAMTISARLHPEKAERQLLAELQRLVRQGVAFADALETLPKDFPVFYVSMVRAGEAAGELGPALTRLAILLARSSQTRERIISALIYPAILMVTLGITLVLILGTVLPRFEAMFTEAGADLPTPTKVVMWLGQAFQDYGLIMLVVLVALGVLLNSMWKRPVWRLRVDRWLIRSRLTLGLPTRTDAARFARTFGALLGGGLALPSALRLAAGSLYNEALKADMLNVLQRVREGSSFAQQLAQCQSFPLILVDMAWVGEETGRLDRTLIEAADILDEDVQRSIDRMLTVLVPALTIAMGALVAGLIGAVLVGILSINDLA